MSSATLNAWVNSDCYQFFFFYPSPAKKHSENDSNNIDHLHPYCNSYGVDFHVLIEVEGSLNFTFIVIVLASP